MKRQGRRSSAFRAWFWRSPARALYLLGAAGLMLSMLLTFALDTLGYATGILREQTITLADTQRYTCVNLEQTEDGTLTSLTGDAQLLLDTQGRVRSLRLAAQYPRGDASEMDLYWHLPGRGYTAAQRVWPVRCGGNAGWCYTVPWLAGQNLRLDLADQSGVAVQVQAIILNERPAWYRYFIPTLSQLFWLAAVPGLLACAVMLGRELAAARRRTGEAK